MTKRLHDSIFLIRNVARLKAWKVWFDSDTHITLLTIFYLLLVSQTTKRYSVLEVFTLILSLELAFAYGVLLSDYYDMPYDKLAGKRRAIYALPKSLIIVLLIALLVLGYIVTVIVIGQVLYLLVYTAWIVVGSFYSAPPIRFKHRAVSGILCDTFMEKVLPVSLVFIYFKYFNYDTLIVILLSFFIQFESIIHHQMEDYEADLRTKIKSLVVKVGTDRALTILNSYIRPVSITLILSFGFIASLKIPVFGLFFFLMLVVYFFMNLLRKKGRLPPGKFGKFIQFGPYSYLYFCLEGPFLLFLGFLSTLRFLPYVSLFLMAIASEYPLFKTYIKVFRASIAFLTGK